MPYPPGLPLCHPDFLSHPLNPEAVLGVGQIGRVMGQPLPTCQTPLPSPGALTAAGSIHRALTSREDAMEKARGRIGGMRSNR